MQKKLASYNTFLKLAEKVNASEPIIALCCRVYYLEKYISIKKQNNIPNTPEENAELGAIFALVDEAKKIYGMSKEEIKDVLEHFCGKNFAYMDKQDHTAPKLTKDHAMNFNATAHYIELLSVYDGMTPKWEEKMKYCKLKASNILKCLKQGIDPPRGNPNNPDPPPAPESNDMPGSSPMHPGPTNEPGPTVSPMDPPAPQFMAPPSNVNFVPPPAGVPKSHLIKPPPQIAPGAPQFASTIVPQRKVDPKNPYNEQGKIVRQHPKYFEVTDKAQKLMERTMSDLNLKNVAAAAKNLTEAYKLLDLLEN